ncbi:MAG: phenylalanine--tRNA ligase subunit beta, partial [Deltaproteobacteria bacterium]|nr:phenylalanine--tRNA ligase subunit beta [Deltaproteobacteria bacterium]
MPVIGIQTELLLQRLGARLEQQELIEHLQHLGCDVEGFATLRRFRCERCGNLSEIVHTQDPPVQCERCGVDFKLQPELLSPAGEVDVLRMELLAVRLDMFDPGGLARMLRAYLGLAKEPPRYPVAPARLRVEVDERMLGPRCPRPAIACAVVQGLSLTDDLVKVVMKLQENLHWALGRDRKHASIGVYDLATLDTDRTLRYRAVGPEELRFVPLGYPPDDPAALLTPRQILEQHPKGRAYAHLLAGWELYPLLHDGSGQVLSLPPIINSEQTRVQLQTRGFFIDVTGTERRIVGRALNVLVTSLLELTPGLELQAVTVAYPDGEVVTPELAPQRVTLDTAETARLIGIPLDDGEAARLLARMGHQVTRWQEGTLEVAVPAYRNDILHPRDLMEDVAIAFGYHNIVPRLDPTFTVGRPLPLEERAAQARLALAGMGLQEVMTLHLTSPEVACDALGLPRREDHVQIANPISVEETMPRISLLPGLLQT